MKSTLVLALGTTASGHYGKPPCASDEIAGNIAGFNGTLCAPPCDDQGNCPTDVPAGTWKATPQCVLNGGPKGHYCALGCKLVGCPPGAHCAMVGIVTGVCVYPNNTRADTQELTIDPDYDEMWKKFKKDFNKQYPDDTNGGQHEEQMRFEIFKANMDHINDVNSKGLSYQLGINQFADLTTEEFALQYTGLKKPDTVWGDMPYLGRHTYSGESLDDSVDWRTKGAVTNVKNQGQCGSCWSFSTTGSLEGAWQIANKQLVAFSEQQFVDCDTGDSGCNGGLMDTAFKYAEKNGICTEMSYPYVGQNIPGVPHKCAASSCTVGLPLGSVTGFKDVDANNEKDLMSAVAKNPVSIAIEADKSAFQLYKSGVLSALCGATLDHGVLAVGYGTESGKDYWLVKNSWGTSWGDSGYIKLERGKGGKGECGILSGPPSYPVIKAGTTIV